MTILRSREIFPFTSTPKTLKERAVLEPSTPSKSLETSTLPTSPLDSTRSPDSCSINAPSMGLDSGSLSVSGGSRRRSLRLASKSESIEISPMKCVPDGNFGGLTEEKADRDGEETDVRDSGFDSCGPRAGVLEVEKGDCGSGMCDGEKLVNKSIKAGPRSEEDDEEEEKNTFGSEKGPNSMGSSGLSFDAGHSRTKSSGAKGKRKLNTDTQLSCKELVDENRESKGFLGLRSGKKVAKRRLKGNNVRIHANGNFSSTSVVEEKGVFNEKDGDCERRVREGSGELVYEEPSLECSNVGDYGKGTGRSSFRRGKKGKMAEKDLESNNIDGVEVVLEEEIDNLNDNSVAKQGSWLINEGQGVVNKGKRKISSVIEESSLAGNMDNHSSLNKNATTNGRNHSGKEKVDGELIGDAISSDSDNKSQTELEYGAEILVDFMASLNELEERNVLPPAACVIHERHANYRNERFRAVARENAARFAYYSSQEQEENHLSHAAATDEIDEEDWPGPFSTAMKIIRNRALKNQLVENSFAIKSKSVSVMWVPKKISYDQSMQSVPSLKELCLTTLAKHADAIASLDSIPDSLRHRLSELLCDSRRMNSRFFELLLCGSPTELRLQDCSWLSEEQFITSFQGCDTSKLMVLQLDQCGRCLPDYILSSTLAQSSYGLPALTTLSLRGACRLSDVGLSTLLSSAPALQSINLSQCSLLTSSSIYTLADVLGSNLRELYLNDCQLLDALDILPALIKLEQLEVLSLAGIQSVSDDFIKELFTVKGHNIKELVLTDCVNLTDSSLKVISESCSGLCALDIVNLSKLTDSSLGYLANGCRTIQTLKLCRNAFSDNAIAAFLEITGEYLEELSLNNIKKVDGNTAISLARRSRKLRTLDLSWCRNLTDEAVGLIVDSCLSLTVLKLFGCSQITNVFLEGHSNPKVQIIGLKMAPVLDNIPTRDLQGTLRYPSVASS